MLARISQISIKYFLIVVPFIFVGTSFEVHADDSLVVQFQKAPNYEKKVEAFFRYPQVYNIAFMATEDGFEKNLLKIGKLERSPQDRRETEKRMEAFLVSLDQMKSGEKKYNKLVGKDPGVLRGLATVLVALPEESWRENKLDHALNGLLANVDAELKNIDLEQAEAIGVSTNSVKQLNLSFQSSLVSTNQPSASIAITAKSAK